MLLCACCVQVHYNSLCVKAPESPSEGSGSASEDSSDSESSDMGGSGSRRKQKLLGSKKLRHAADALMGH
jgi:hypothetical protein